MYQALGSLWLSQQVKETTTPIGQAVSNKLSQELESTIHQRAPLLLYDGQQLRSSKDVLPQADKLLEKLQVLQVPSIEISRQFQGIKKKQTTTACLMANRQGKNYILFIMNEFDYFDVAK
jgi:hypothetical protein